MRTVLSSASVVALALAPVSAQTTWTVNAAGGAQFTAIQPAIAAASPGDRIVVQGFGFVPYAGFVVDKGVDVESEQGVRVGSIDVVGVPLGQRARVGRFQLTQNLGAVSVRNCSGAVLLWAVSVVTPFSPVPQPVPPVPVAVPSLEIVASSPVFVADCGFSGQRGSQTGSPCVVVDASNVVFSDCHVVGGTLLGNGGIGESGTDAVHVLSGDVVYADGSLYGAHGQPGTTAGGSGGDAIEVVAGKATLLDNAVYAGLGGTGPTAGSDGLAARGNVHHTPLSSIAGGTLGTTVLPDRAHLDTPPSVAPGTNMPITIHGTIGTIVGLGFDFTHGHLVLPGFDVPLALSPTPALLTVHVLNSPFPTVQLWIPDVPAARNLDVYVQGVELGPNGLLLTGAARSRVQ